MEILAWLIVGLVAGLLASFVVGGTGYGIVGAIVAGIAGAFVGGWMFREMGWHTPFHGLPGTIFVAFLGAIVVLLLVHVVQRRTRRTT